MLHTFNLDWSMLIDIGTALTEVSIKGGQGHSKALEVDIQLSMIADLPDPAERERQMALLLHEVRARKAASENLYSSLTTIIKKASEQLMVQHGNLMNMQFFAKPS